MTTINNLRILITCISLMFIVLICGTSCDAISSLTGGGDDALPSSAFDSNEILRVCYDGWTENPDTKVCECLPPSVIIGQYECRTIEPQDWYSDMNGCLVNQGMLFRTDVPLHPDSVTSYLNEPFYVEVPDTNSRFRLLHRGSMRFLPRGERFDSIQLYLPSSVRLPYYVWPTINDDGYNTGFHGVILNDSTLVGQFVFGPMYDSWGLDRSRIFSECEAVIRRGRVQ